MGVLLDVNVKVTRDVATPAQLLKTSRIARFSRVPNAGLIFTVTAADLVQAVIDPCVGGPVHTCASTGRAKKPPSKIKVSRIERNELECNKQPCRSGRLCLSFIKGLLG